MTFAEGTALIMALLAALSLLIAVSRNRKQDISADAQVKSDLGYIKNRIDEMVIDQKAMNQNMGELNARVARCEENVRQAHKRMDEHLLGHMPGE